MFLIVSVYLKKNDNFNFLSINDIFINFSYIKLKYPMHKTSPKQIT